ncbi:hypothetical protein K4H04_21870, partial [Mycobacterium tuberculosis]|nr:hypothetical protein [Mycobacterium tuberculosis]
MPAGFTFVLPFFRRPPPPFARASTPRLARERCVAQINRLVRAADKVIFIQHDEAGGLEAGSEGFALLPELEQPAGALYVTKTACDAFYHT